MMCGAFSCGQPVDEPPCTGTMRHDRFLLDSLQVGGAHNWFSSPLTALRRCINACALFVCPPERSPHLPPSRPAVHGRSCCAGLSRRLLVRHWRQVPRASRH